MIENNKGLKDSLFYSFLKENNIKCYITTTKDFYKKAFIESFSDKTITTPAILLTPLNIVNIFNKFCVTNT